MIFVIEKWRVLQASFGSIGSMVENDGTGGIDAVVDPFKKNDGTDGCLFIEVGWEDDNQFLLLRAFSQKNVHFC